MSGCAAEYVELRSLIVDSAERYLSKEHLKRLISTFQPDINSKRRSSYVNNFNDLITILEKRGCVGETSVGPFRRLVKLLPNHGIIEEMLSNFHIHRNRCGVQCSYVNHNGKSTLIY
jgi:hypothetical protein